MKLLNTIFSFELQQLRRQKFVLFLLSFFMLAGAYSIYTGHEFTKRQQLVLDSLKQTYDVKYKEIEASFMADTSTAEGKLSFTQAGIPAVVEYRNPLYAVNTPQSLTSLSVGQRDLVPYYDMITRKRNFVQSSNAEIENPEMLASGNFDLAYVIVYLLPLLAIALAYNTWSKEKEQQTDRLLAIQSMDFKRIVVYKLAFRFLVVAALTWLLSIAGIISDACLIPFNLVASVFWLLTVTVYLFFWFSICLLVIRLGQSSAANALYLLAAWCFFLILLPAVTNTIIRQLYPIPLKIDAAVALRENSEAIWAMPKQHLIDTFYLYNPKYRHLKSTSDTSETSTKRFAAYYDLLGRRMTNAITNYNRYPEKQQGKSANLNWFNPATKAQYLLNSIAETGLRDYLSYQNEVNHFQKTWVDFMTHYVINDKKLSLNDLHHLPAFVRPHLAGKNKNILTGIAGLFLISSCIILLSNKIPFKI